MRFKREVAQKRQSKLQPTWLETQAVVLVLVGISTDSTIKSSCKRTAFLIVPSLLRCISSTLIWLMTKLASSISRVAFERLVIPSNECADFCQSHSYT